MTDPMSAIRTILGMPEPVDHLREAKVKSDAATSVSGDDIDLLPMLAEGHLHAAIAQAEAAEALVEQQRIGNLIAYWQLHTPRSAEESLSIAHVEVHLLDAGDGFDIDKAVREGLGLA